MIQKNLTNASGSTSAKPNNILINRTRDKQGNKTITDVALDDFDIDFKSEKGEPRHTPYTVANRLWRRPDRKGCEKSLKQTLVWASNKCTTFDFKNSYSVLLAKPIATHYHVTKSRGYEIT